MQQHRKAEIWMTGLMRNADENKSRKLNITPGGLDCRSLSTRVNQTSGQGLFKQERDSFCIEEGEKSNGYCVWIQTTRTNVCVWRLSSVIVNSSRPVVRAPVYPPTFGDSFIRLVPETKHISLGRSCNTGKEEGKVKLPLQLFPQFFDLLVLLGQDLLHVAVGCRLLELLLQLLQMWTREG